MSVLGQQLREAREKRGLTLADVEADIKIRQSVLRALEEGNGAEFPPAVFARGLIRKYAAYLELDPGWALELFEQEHGRVTPARFSPVLEEPLYRRRRDWSEWLLGAGVAILCAIVAFLVWQNSIAPLRQIARPGVTATAVVVETTPSAPAAGQPTAQATSAQVQVALALPSPTVAVTAPPPTRTPVLQPTPENPSEPTATLLPTVGATPTLAPPTPAPTVPPNEVEVSVEITQPSWLQVTVDGKQVFAAILQPGQNRAWRGTQSVNLRTGNAGGTIIFVNGQAVGTLGNPGAVVEREWQLGQGDVVMLAPGQQRPPTVTPTPSQ